MTRCLNCGAERTTDECEICGLGSVAAEFALRRKLLGRTAFFLIGALGFVLAGGRYPPLELDGILIFIGVLFFFTLGLAMLVERRALRHAEVEAFKRVYYGLVPIPWLLALLLLANGAFDRAPGEGWNARVVSRFAMAGPLTNRRLVVTSWRDDHRFERIPVVREDFDRFHPGDDVVVHVKEGLVGIPWISEVSRR
ncbi:MAG: hypothetical protein WBC04_00705 [Candidatus Acidiferrales bacterium]